MSGLVHTPLECPNCGNRTDFVKTSESLRCEYCQSILQLPFQPQQSANSILESDRIDSEVIRLAQAGDKIKAIARYRQITGVGLRDAKMAVDSLETLEPARHTGHVADHSHSPNNSTYAKQVLGAIRNHAGVHSFPYAAMERKELIDAYARVTKSNESHAQTVIDNSFAVYLRSGIITTVLFVLTEKGVEYAENSVSNLWSTNWGELKGAKKSGSFSTKIKGPYCDLKINDNDPEVQSFVKKLLTAL